MKILLFSLLLASSTRLFLSECHAANLTQAQPYADTVVYSNGQPYTRVWANTTGHPIYITAIQTFFGTNYFDGTIVVCTVRQSDQSQLQYIGWPDCNFMGGPVESPPQSFAPDYFELLPGDSLLMQSTATSDNGGLNEQILVSIYIWYRTTAQP